MSNVLGSESGTTVCASKLARFTLRVVSIAQKAVVGEPAPAFAPGETGYVDWVIVALHGVREYLGDSYRQLLDVLHEMPRIVSKLDLAVAELPDFTTVCTCMKNLEMACWRALLRLSGELHEPGGVQAIDATGFDRRAASRRYARRTNHTFRAVNTTELVDYRTNTMLDIHCSMKRPHDIQIGEQRLRRNLDRIGTITADNRYDWDELRRNLRDDDVRPVIKHREYSWLDAAHNARLDDETHHRRSIVESVIRSLNQRFGDTLRARTRFGQFRELARRAAVNTIEAALSA